MAATDRPSTVCCRRNCRRARRFMDTSSAWFCCSRAMSTRVLSSALAWATRSDKSCNRDDTVRQVATAGSKRRDMKPPMVDRPAMRVSRSSAMRVRTSSA